MRRDFVSTVVVLVATCVGLAGCGVTITGNIVNASGAAMTGVRLAAQPTQPGAKQPAETVSQKKGSFKLTGLAPETEYAVLPELANWASAPLWSVRLKSESELNLFGQNGWYKDQRLLVTTSKGATVLTQPLVIEPVFCSLEGVAMDARQKPIEGVTLLATQTEPVEKYDRVEAKTTYNGHFTLEKLFPDAEYVILPIPANVADFPSWTVRLGPDSQPLFFDRNGWRDEKRIAVRAPANQQPGKLEVPLIIQPHVSSLSGVVELPDRGAVADVTVIAKLVRPVPDYDVFRATTDANGRFLLPHLLPNAEYELYVGEVDPAHLLLTVRQPDPHGENALGAPLVPGFRCTDGIVTDLATSLQWAPSPDQEISWQEAKSYAEDLDLAGSDDWRLPTLAELRSLYRRGIGGSFGIHPALTLTGCCVWSSEESSCFMFTTGYATTADPKNRFNNRVLAVRNGQ